MDAPKFIFITCQIGAEAAVKVELARKWPAFRFAYSRPGFLTFKLPPGLQLVDDFDLHSVFARSYGLSLGKASGANNEERASEVWRLADGREFDCLHVWQRDLYEPGFRGYEPEMTELASVAEAAIRAAEGSGTQRVPGVQGSAIGEQNSGAGIQNLDVVEQQSAALAARGSARVMLHPRRIEPPNSARAGQLVLDCVIVEPREWWIGYHRAASIPSRWAGGMFNMELPTDAVSRAYLKMEEALAWSQMPLRTGDVWVEIGSALVGPAKHFSHGLRVIGIDPADMDPLVLANPTFAHWKKRGGDVRRREFRPVRYLAADINVAPSYTLETAENIVTHPEVQIRGLLLTLKLLDWKLADEVPGYLDRVRSWGYAHVRARQLHHNRQEICVAAR